MGDANKSNSSSSFQELLECILSAPDEESRKKAKDNLYDLLWFDYDKRLRQEEICYYDEFLEYLRSKGISLILERMLLNPQNELLRKNGMSLLDEHKNEAFGAVGGILDMLENSVVATTRTQAISFVRQDDHDDHDEDEDEDEDEDNDDSTSSSKARKKRETIIKFCLRLLQGEQEVRMLEKRFLRAIHAAMKGNYEEDDDDGEIQELAMAVLYKQYSDGNFEEEFMTEYDVFSTIITTMERYQDRPILVQNAIQLLGYIRIDLFLTGENNNNNKIMQFTLKALRTYRDHESIPETIYDLFERQINDIGNLITGANDIRFYIKHATSASPCSGDAIRFLKIILDNNNDTFRYMVEPDAVDGLVQVLKTANDDIIDKTWKEEVGQASKAEYPAVIYHIIKLFNSICEIQRAEEPPPETTSSNIAMLLVNHGLAVIILKASDPEVAWAPIACYRPIPGERHAFDLLSNLYQANPHTVGKQISPMIERVVQYELHGYCVRGLPVVLTPGMAKSNVCHNNHDGKSPLHHVAGLISNKLASYISSHPERRYFFPDYYHDNLIGFAYNDIKGFLEKVQIAYPNAVCSYDKAGYLPIHYALKNNITNLDALKVLLINNGGDSGGTKNSIDNSAMHCHHVDDDDDDGFRNFPLALYGAAIDCNLTTIYFLLRRDPSQIKTMSTSTTKIGEKYNHRDARIVKRQRHA